MSFEIAQERIYLTADRKTAVSEKDKRAASLYAAPGTRIPEGAAKTLGIVNGFIKGSVAQKAASKEAKPVPNKKQKPVGTKGA